MCTLVLMFELAMLLEIDVYPAHGLAVHLHLHPASSVDPAYVHIASWCFKTPPGRRILKDEPVDDVPVLAHLLAARLPNRGRRGDLQLALLHVHGDMLALRCRDESSRLTAADVIAKAGYPREVHYCTTADKYNLRLTRITRTGEFS